MSETSGDHRQIAAARQALGLGQREAARLARVSLGTYNKAEQGKGITRPSTLKKIREALGVAAELGGHDYAAAAGTLSSSWVSRLPRSAQADALTHLTRAMADFERSLDPRQEATAIVSEAGIGARLDAERRRNGLDPMSLQGDELRDEDVASHVDVPKRRKS